MRIKRSAKESETVGAANSKRRIPIKTKLLAAFGVTAFLLVAVAATAVSGYRSQAAVVEELIDVDTKIELLASHAEAQLLSARHSEALYLAAAKLNGPEAAHSAYVPAWEVQVAGVEHSLSEIASLASHGTDPELIAIGADIVEAQEHLHEYVIEFTDVTHEIEARGFEGSGAEAELRASALEIEEELEAFHEPVLELHFELFWGVARDYLGVAHEEKVAEVDHAVELFEEELAESELSPGNITLLTEQLEVFLAEFDEIAVEDADIKAELSQMEIEATELEVALDDVIERSEVLIEESRHAMEASEASTERILIILSIVGASGAIAFGWGLSKSISRRIKAVAEGAKQLAVGDTSAESFVSNSNDEISDLEASLSEAREYLIDAEKVATTIASGDVSIEIIPKSEDDSLGRALVSMVVSLRDLVGAVDKMSSQVDQASSELAMGAKESTQAAGEVADSIALVAEGANQQAATAEQMSTSLTEISEGTDSVGSAAGEVGSASTDAKSKAGTGQERLDEATRAMSEINVTIDRTSDVIAQLDEHSARVEEIIELVKTIAEQTNLLALNAAIEAARAGELGKGFAVVAAEVKGLAEETARSTEEIGGIVSQMRKSVTDATTAMESTKTVVDKGSGVISAAGEAFSDIVEAVEQIQDKASIVVESVDRIEEAASVLRSNSDELKSVSEQNSSASEEVAATSEEAAASAATIGQTAEELAGTAAELTKTIGRFNLEASASSSE